MATVRCGVAQPGAETPRRDASAGWRTSRCSGPGGALDVALDLEAAPTGVEVAEREQTLELCFELAHGQCERGLDNHGRPCALAELKAATSTIGRMRVDAADRANAVARKRSGFIGVMADDR